MLFRSRADAGASERFDVELNAARGQCAAILTVKPADIVAGEWRTIRIQVDCRNRKATAQSGDAPAIALPAVDHVPAVSAITFRTGARAAPASTDQDRPTEVSRYEVTNLVVR